MKKSFFLIAIIILSLVLFGCASNKEATKKQTFIGGTDALSIEFIDGTPPDEVFERTQPFDIIMLVKNEGEYDVKMDDIKEFKITGIDPAEFDNFNNVIEKLNTDLRGKFIDSDGKTIEGAQTYESFTEDKKARYTGDVSGKSTFPIRAELCYTYGTIAQGELCIKEKPLDVEDNSVCDVRGTKSIESSSSPIKISNLKQDAQSATSITFSFDVIHQGTGTVFDKNAENPCDDSTIVDKNKVDLTVEIIAPGELELSCSGFNVNEGSISKGQVTLVQGRAPVRCVIDTTSVTSDFNKLIKITAEFDYKQFESKTIVVKDNDNVA